MFKPGQHIGAYLLADAAHALHGGRALRVILARLLGRRRRNGLGGLLKALVQHARNNLVRELVDNGEDGRMRERNRQLAALGREADEDTGRQNEEEDSNVESR